MHPFISILTYIAIMLTMSFLPSALFWLLCLSVFLTAFYLQHQIFLQKLRNLKWLFLSIFLVCAFGTPGEYLTNAMLHYLPTKEGMMLGAEQSAKMLLAISSLSILFYKKNIKALIQGIYLLLLPLKYFKLNVNQFSVRLLLTLNYVNTITQLNNKKMRFSEIYQAAQALPKYEELNIVQFSITPFSMLDYAMLGLIFFYLSIVFKFAS